MEKTLKKNLLHYIKIQLQRGSFKNHVDIILLFFDHPPTSVDIFYVLNLDKKGNFLTTYPPSVVHVVFEWSSK